MSKVGFLYLVDTFLITNEIFKSSLYKYSRGVLPKESPGLESIISDREVVMSGIS